jgi:hypothetical protein
MITESGTPDPAKAKAVPPVVPATVHAGQLPGCRPGGLPGFDGLGRVYVTLR